jgi:type IV pilus assembly protein PilE
MNNIYRRKPSEPAGFTMLELALVLVILGLIILVTISAIMDHRTSSQKKQVAHRMNEVAEWMRTQYAQKQSYMGILPADWTTQDSGQRYQISLTAQPVVASDPNTQFPALGPATYTLQAVPAQADACGTLLLDHTGRRGVTGEGATVAACW